MQLGTGRHHGGSVSDTRPTRCHKSPGGDPKTVLQPLSGATRLLPIIGDPIRYVESPVRFTRTLAARGHDGICIPMQIPEGDLGVVMAGFAATPHGDGLLVALPPKHTAPRDRGPPPDRARLPGSLLVLR